jgi:hypothetical protein
MRYNEGYHKQKTLTRLEKVRELRRFLIVCEGEKTEPNYFRKFPDNPEVYDRAVQNARKLFALQYNKSLTEQNPITTVFKLVERLLP